jgi:mitogen-activated protein kinase kinase kinase
LSDAELIEICRSTDRPEKERLILRKRHMYPTHEEFKRKGTINARRQYQNNDDDTNSKPSSLYSWSQESNSRPDYLSKRSSQVGSFRSQTNSSTNRTRRRFFGERPPSEIISSNLPSFFPNHNREVLETAGIKAQRLSTTRRNSAMSRMEPRNYRNSVLPELVSVLGVDLDKFLEEEEEGEEEEEEGEEQVDEYQSTLGEKDSTQLKNGDPELEYEEKQDEETFIHPTAQPENVTLNRTSSLNNDIKQNDANDNSDNSSSITTSSNINNNNNSTINNISASTSSSSSNNNNNINNSNNMNNNSSSNSNSDGNESSDTASNNNNDSK